MPAAFLGLGSNLGGREESLARALALLEGGGFRTSRTSALYETAPVGGPPQGDFLNQVVAGEWSDTPERLLEACLAAERALGRVRGERFGPRTVDVDVLLFGDLVRDAPPPVVPHPRLHERRFVLVPLVEIAPEVRHPRLAASARELLARCPDSSRVARWERS
ncbi:MAG TPA: 2-amino-4-hydroxy-6-hydroxymethyldihydropteridine diphosphokinase [Vicinamibacteria bacterium]|nr:2-amino-4-hydroxy-6-hydroxymethyldihydropteridine diphosphokinase [Vicinamibacteria bacterium]